MPQRNRQPPPVKVLVVDDDETFRRAMATVLRDGGYEYVEAASAEQARASLVAGTDVVAVLCDIRMPGDSGLDLLKQIAADLPEVAVIMTTVLDDPDAAQAAFDLGAFGYLVKPIEATELLIALRGALTRRELQASRESYVRGLERAMARTRTVQGVLDALEGAVSTAEPDGDGETVERLSRALSLRDEETGRHIERMSRYAAVVAEAVGLRGRSPEEVRLATALHDVGKIGVPDSILLKPGSLSPEEYSTMQRHAQIGYQLLADASSSLVGLAADIALCHHEWWDGGGYPRGLKEDEIPEEARIAAVTDVFDALTSNRVYRPGLPVDEAMAIMTPMRGRHFEARAFDAFVGAMDEVLSIRERFPDVEVDSRIRLLLVDDHELFVQSLVRLLGAAPGIKVVGGATTVAEGVHAARVYEPDVVLMDFELPDGDGVDATRQIKALLPRTKVVMLTGRTDEYSMVRAIDAGCAGFVTKTQATETLLEAIHAAHADEAVLSSEPLDRLLRQLRPTRRGLGAGLSRRELDILALMGDGMTDEQLAQHLGLGLQAVRTHVDNVLYKLHAHSKLEAVATAVREGIVARSRDVQA
jgi:putative two-component system response regulator